MNEIVKKYIGKECIIYFGVNGGSVNGVIEGVEDNWISVVKKNNDSELVSLDFVSRIKEYPKDKKGKRKNIVLD